MMCDSDDVIAFFTYGLLSGTVQPVWRVLRCSYGKSVRPSVGPSGIVSKQGNAEGCGLHRRVAQCL